MATPTLSPTSVTVPNGGTSDVAVAWALNPGTPDVSGTLSLVVNGQPVSIPVLHAGTPGEAAPRLVTSNPQPGDVLVSCDVAAASILAQGNPGTIRLS